MPTPSPTTTHSRAGLLLALASALAFGTSGTLARALLDAGWTPAAAVIGRAVIATLLLAAPTIWQLRGRWSVLARGWRTVVLFGVLGVGITQFAYFQAVQFVSVGVALLLEYLGVILVVGWLWLRHGQRPRKLSVIGGIVAIVGLVGVLDVVSGANINAPGAAWGLFAAVGLAAYFLVSADDRSGLPPVALACLGLATGAAILTILGVVGLLPLHTSTGDVALASWHVPWWLALGLLGLISTAAAYSLGIAAARALGSKVASFVGLSEVVFAVLIAWAFLGQLPTAIQLLGGLLIMAGVIAVKIDERPRIGTDA